MSVETKGETFCGFIFILIRYTLLEVPPCTLCFTLCVVLEPRIRVNQNMYESVLLRLKLLGIKSNHSVSMGTLNLSTE